MDYIEQVSFHIGWPDWSSQMLSEPYFLCFNKTELYVLQSKEQNAFV